METTRIVKCSVCGSWLTNPVSVERGIGPVCLARLLKESETCRRTIRNLKPRYTVRAIAALRPKLLMRATGGLKPRLQV